MTTEDRDIRLKRLRIRSWRRGTKEMDLILGPFSDAADGLALLDDRALDAYEALLEEGDNDLYLWASGTQAAPPEHQTVLRIIQDFHKIA